MNTDSDARMNISKNKRRRRERQTRRKPRPQKPSITAPTYAIMDGMGAWERNIDSGFGDLTVQWKSEERKRKIEKVLLSALQDENGELKDEVEKLKSIIENIKNE